MQRGCNYECEYEESRPRWLVMLTRCVQARQYRHSSHHHYGYGYGQDQYGEQQGHAGSRSDTDKEDVLGMVGTALDNFQDMNEDAEDDFSLKIRNRNRDYYY